MIDKSFWADRRVFVTGHSGFKGAWLGLLLRGLGARVSGYALRPPTEPSLFELCRMEEEAFGKTTFADVRDRNTLFHTMLAAKPEVVIHLAAQPLVLRSYQNPPETYETNILGTVNLLEVVRAIGDVRAVVNVTTDKCYHNREWLWGYREDEALGGYDPYSSSKACTEIITASYRQSFFHPDEYHLHGTGIATARSGNVIGGGDWAQNRLVPDVVRALLKNEQVIIRNPAAVRPWQHVLEPLAGYLALAQNLCREGPLYSEAWNFGSAEEDARSVGWIVQNLCAMWGEDAFYQIEQSPDAPHEANYLKLDSSKARARLNWRPRWNLTQSLEKVVEWFKAYQDGQSAADICRAQIEKYLSTDENDKE